MASFSYLLLAITVASFLTISAARPCKTFLVSSYSLSITPENPNLESDFTSTRSFTVFTIRRLNPHQIVPVFINRHQEKPQILRSNEDRSQSSLPFISQNINSFRDRTKDILSVVVALLFGVGCGALTAATMYVAWAVVVNRRSYDFEEDDYENDESEAIFRIKLLPLSVSFFNFDVVFSERQKSKKSRGFVLDYLGFCSISGLRL